MLTDTQKTQFVRDGYLALENFKSTMQITALKREAGAIIDEFDAKEQRSIFSTDDQLSTTDDYFLSSACNISCFFEEHAFDCNGDLGQPKHLSINKIGHALHDLNPVFDRFSRDNAIEALIDDLGFDMPQLWQSMYIFKQPGIGGEVKWHQDASFFHTEPLSVVTLWFALEDATLENGCLWIEPGGHRSPLRERFVVRNGRPAFVQLNDQPWPDASTAVALPMAAGGLICFNGLMPHYSAPNRSKKSRHAYTLHITDGHTAYSAENWLQRPSSFPARGFRG